MLNSIVYTSNIKRKNDCFVMHQVRQSLDQCHLSYSVVPECNAVSSQPLLYPPFQCFFYRTTCKMCTAKRSICFGPQSRFPGSDLPELWPPWPPPLVQRPTGWPRTAAPCSWESGTQVQFGVLLIIGWFNLTHPSRSNRGRAPLAPFFSLNLGPETKICFWRKAWRK